ncbi:MAG: hypothetical protein R2746_14655 [Acidimicrobiales bacterium]
MEIYGQQWWEYRLRPQRRRQLRRDHHRQRPRDPRRRGHLAAHQVLRRHPLVVGARPQRQEGRRAGPHAPGSAFINADKPGEYIGQCTEFCGLSHAEMRIKVVALDRAGFDACPEHQLTGFVNPTEEAAQRAGPPRGQRAPRATSPG